MDYRLKPAKTSLKLLSRRALFVTVVASMAVAAACGSESGPEAQGADASADGAPQPSFPTDSGGPNFQFDAGFEEKAPPRECTVPPGFDDCTDRCGPIRNPCTGVIVKQCGLCQGVGDAGDGGALVCDLESNTCVTPKITCADLGAECGRVKNSCGIYLDCPAGDPNIECTAGDPGAGLAAQECDPDTKKCRTATAVTCKDLGYECGQAWLGAGPKTNLTNCGDCSNFVDGGAGDKPRCSPILRVCEPACAAPTTADQKKALCDAAKASRGLECGIISDGCGGTVDCGEVGFTCAAGEECGFGGIANRCTKFETPVECQAAGRNCGTIKSICTGANISCGQCTGTDVCNANGVCGPPCVPKKCADLGSPQCLPSSAPIPDGCGGNVSDCPVCPGGQAACQPNTDGGVGGTCCVPQFSCTNRPPGIAGDACGSQLFDNGCGVLLNCGCAGGSSCVNNTCCTANACPAPGAAGETCGSTNLGCGATCTRTCAADPQGNNNLCTGNVCCNPEPDSATEWRTANPGRCQFNIPNGCGGFVDAPCTSGACIDVATGPGNEITDPGGTTPTAMGYCCTTASSACTGNNTCQTVANACILGRTVNCSAADCADGADGVNDEVCAGTPRACCDPLACPAASPEGGQCGSFDRTCGLNCTQGCQADAQGNANTCVAGTCCNPEPDNPAEWRSSNPGGCGFNIPNGCGGLVDAPCTSGVCQNAKVQVLDVGTTQATGTCCDPATSCGGTKAVGEDCVVPNACLNGQNVNCACVGGATCFQNKCCAPAACPPASPVGGACGTFDRGCGQSCTRACVAGSSCFNGTCCTPVACPAPGAIGDSCGTFDRGCGQNCSRTCDTTGGKTNSRCQGNVCTCTPTPCPAGFVGSMQNGCGQVVACSGG